MYYPSCYRIKYSKQLIWLPWKLQHHTPIPPLSRQNLILSRNKNKYVLLHSLTWPRFSIKCGTKAFFSNWNPSSHSTTTYYSNHTSKTGTYFFVRSGSALSEINPIHTGVLQGAVATPHLFNLYISNQPTTNHTITADFADDKAIMALNSDPEIASNLIQLHLNLLQTWYNDWGIKINELKSAHCTFTLKPRNCPSITLNNLPIPPIQNIRYLSLHLDRDWLGTTTSIPNVLLWITDPVNYISSLHLNTSIWATKYLYINYY